MYCTMTDEAPPSTYDLSWWDNARYMQPLTEKDETTGEEVDVEPLPLPTPEEAKILRNVACHVCGISVDACDNKDGCGGSGNSRL